VFAPTRRTRRKEKIDFSYILREKGKMKKKSEITVEKWKIK